MGFTWNPNDKSTNISLSNGNLTYTATNTAWKSVRATDFKSSGKWYWEVTIDVEASNQHILGIGTSSANIGSYAGSDAYGYGYNGANGNKNHNASGETYGNSFGLNDIIGVALDLYNGKIWWSKNGIWQGDPAGVPASGTNEAYSGLSGSFYPMGSPNTNINAATANFGATSFSYSIPAGFLPLEYNGYFSGYVYEQSSPIVRTLYLHNRTGGELMNTTTSSGNGYYYLTTTYSGSHYIVCLDDAAGSSYNDLIIGNVTPTTVSG